MGKNNQILISISRKYGSGGHEIASLSKAFNPDYFRKGYVYTFEIWYYAITPGTNYLIALDGTPANHMIKQGVFQKGLQKATIEYTVAENDAGITFFTGNAVDIYLGNMTITLKGPAGNSVMTAGTSASVFADRDFLLFRSSPCFKAKINPEL